MLWVVVGIEFQASEFGQWESVELVGLQVLQRANLRRRLEAN